MGLMRLRGQRSASTTKGARAFLGSRWPHRREDVGLWSIPISVTPGLRIPLIGTTLLASPMARALSIAARRIRFLNLELHAIDLADAGADDLSPRLARRQPELRVPLAMRRERLRAILMSRGGGQPLRAAVQ
jgi:hypothetical protein